MDKKSKSSKRKRIVRIRKGHDKQDVTFDESLLPDVSTPQTFSAFIQNSTSILGSETDFISNLTFVDRSYKKQLTRAINRFYQIIRSHPSLKILADEIIDPESETSARKPRFVILCRGEKTNSRKRIVNTCMLIVAQKLRKKSSSVDLDWSSFWLDNSLFSLEHADACYQPNVTSLYHRHLFKYFHDEGILFSLSNDFKFEGGFDAYWKKLFAFAKEKRPKEFGERPNKACFDVDSDYKIRNEADPPFTPFELNKKGYDDCMLLMAHYTCVDWCLRGAKEVRLIVVCYLLLYFHCHLTPFCKPSQITREHFELYVKETGEYKGRECLRLCNHTEEKKKKLCLGDYLCRKNEGQFDMVDFPDDEFSVVRLYKHIEEHFFPSREMEVEVGRFFRRAASRKQMKVCLIVVCV